MSKSGRSALNFHRDRFSIAWLQRCKFIHHIQPGCSTAAGFTLLELLVVMVIIGLLAGYVAPQYFGVVAKSEVKVAKTQIDAFQKALVAYRLDVGDFPPSQVGLAALVQAPAGVTNWAGPYLSKAVPNDPWGNAYLYASPGKHSVYDVWSHGRDGRPGGQGEDTDIGNW